MYESFIIAAILCINIFAFVITGLDKGKALKNKWRISEKMLIIMALLGGALGVYLAMVIFSHKTSKTIFRTGVLILLFLQGALAVMLFF